MIKRIIALVTSLAVVLGLMASNGSFAWFVTSVKRAQRITIGVVSFDSSSAVSLDTLEEDFYGKACIYPGQNLVMLDGDNASISMYNSSTVDSQIRVKIEYTSFADGVAKNVVYSGSEDEDLQVVFANPEQWLPFDNGLDGTCYYYVGPDYGKSAITDLDDVYTISPDVADVEIIESVYYKESIDASLYSGNEVTVNVIFEAKQADYVGWSSLGEYQVATEVE
ncbi:MAG: hypothetical protein IJZ88_04715 [Clostridia bacterium]|nr:hypothetical protein [Clostridia bacterium]